MASIYDLENVRLMREGLNPLVNLAGQQAELSRARYLQELALQDEARRTFRNQQFQREQQAAQIAGYGKNQLDLLRARQEAEDKIAVDRRTQASKSFGAVNNRLAQVDSDLAAATQELEIDRQQRLRKMAEQAAQATLKPGTKLDLAGNPEHQALLTTEMMRLEEKGVVGPNLTLAAKVSGLKNERDRLTTASAQLLDDAVRYGADISALVAPRGGSSSAGPSRPAGLPVPPKAKPEAKPTAAAQTPAELRGPNYVQGDVTRAAQDVSAKVRNALAALGTATRAPMVSAGNFLARRFGGNILPTDDSIYTPEERARLENARRFLAQNPDLSPQPILSNGALAPGYEPEFGPMIPPIAPRVDALDPSVIDALRTPDENAMTVLNMLRPVTNALRY